MHCLKCHEPIILDEKIKTKGGIRIPLDPTTKKFHKCKTSVHKRKGMLRVLTRTQLEYYKTLKTYPGATVQEIQDAFDSEIKRWHPDRWTHTPDSLRKTAEINYKKVIEAHNNIRLIRVLDE